MNEIVTPGGERFTPLIMPAWIEGHSYGVKMFNIAPGRMYKSVGVALQRLGRRNSGGP